MTEAVEVINASGVWLDEERLRTAVRVVLEQQERALASGVAIQVTDDDTVRQLNATYRGVDAPTDVLSFPADMPPLPPNADGTPEELHLGDLAIAYPYTAAQAAQLGHNLGDTLVLLVVHGTLHLLGYDHDTPANKAGMWAAQARALAALGVPATLLPTLEAEHDQD